MSTPVATEQTDKPKRKNLKFRAPKFANPQVLKERFVAGKAAIEQSPLVGTVIAKASGFTTSPDTLKDKLPSKDVLKARLANLKPSKKPVTAPPSDEEEI